MRLLFHRLRADSLTAEERRYHDLIVDGYRTHGKAKLFARTEFGEIAFAFPRFEGRRFIAIGPVQINKGRDGQEYVSNCEECDSEDSDRQLINVGLKCNVGLRWL